MEAMAVASSLMTGGSAGPCRSFGRVALGFSPSALTTTTGHAPTPSGNPHHYLQQVTDFALMVTGQDRARRACAALESGVDLPRDWADHEFKTYVTLGNDARLADLLLHSRLLVLHAGQVGSRRWTAALRLLSTLSGPRMTIRRIRREFGDSFDMTGLRGRWRHWLDLDLRDPDERLPTKTDLSDELLQTSDLVPTARTSSY
jgi:hypothetical protein